MKRTLTLTRCSRHSLDRSARRTWRRMATMANKTEAVLAEIRKREAEAVRVERERLAASVNSNRVDGTAATRSNGVPQDSVRGLRRRAVNNPYDPRAAA